MRKRKCNLCGEKEGQSFEQFSGKPLRFYKMYDDNYLCYNCHHDFVDFGKKWYEKWRKEPNKVEK